MKPLSVELARTRYKQCVLPCPLGFKIGADAIFLSLSVLIPKIQGGGRDWQKPLL